MATQAGGLPAAQRGVALLTVLLIFVVAALLAADMALTGIGETERVWLRREMRQAYYYALGAETYARELLWQDRDSDRRAGRQVDGRSDIWEDGAGSFDLDEGQIRIQLTDLQSRFNLARLRAESGGLDAAAVENLRRLLVLLRLDPRLATRIVDWLEEQGILDPVGVRTPQASASRTGPIGDAMPIGLAELTPVLVLTEQQQALLTAHLTSLPQRTKLNINTAGPETLRALGGGQGRAATAMTRQREVTPYTDLERALSDHGMTNIEAMEGLVDTASDWYEIEVTAVYRQHLARLRSVLHRDADSGITRVIYRSPVVNLRIEQYE